MIRRLSAWGPAAIWAGVLFFLSAVPDMDVPPMFFQGEDKVAHLLLYGVLGGTLAWGRFRSGGPGQRWLVPALGLLYAVSDEWHQSWVPGRDPSLGDLAADTLGLLLGYWMFSSFSMRRAEAAAVPPSNRSFPGPTPE